MFWKKIYRVIKENDNKNKVPYPRQGEEGKRTSGTRLARYLDQNSLKPFIYSEKSADHFAPIECYLGKSKINGYEATTLVDICDAFLEARKHIKLTNRPMKIVEYMILTDNGLLSLEMKVNNCMKIGQQPFGSLSLAFNETQIVLSSSNGKIRNRDYGFLSRGTSKTT